jgi:hypothetical protein
MRWRNWENDPPPVDARVQICRKHEPEPLGCYEVAALPPTFNVQGLYWRPDPLSDPTVQAVLDRWPGARITAVRGS